jgi:hypothetical protein
MAKNQWQITAQTPKLVNVVDEDGKVTQQSRSKDDGPFDPVIDRTFTKLREDGHVQRVKDSGDDESSSSEDAIKEESNTDAPVGEDQAPVPDRVNGLEADDSNALNDRGPTELRADRAPVGEGQAPQAVAAKHPSAISGEVVADEVEDAIDASSEEGEGESGSDDEGDELDDLEISDRVKGLLREHGMVTIEALKDASDEELEDLDGIGAKSVEEIREALD